MDFKCDIPEKQNTDKFLDRLAAYSHLYRQAKLCLGIQFALTVPSALLSAVIILFVPEAKIWTTFYALTVTLLDSLVFERIQNHYRRLAARVQELFDCDLLGIGWNSVRVGCKPGADEFFVATLAYRKKNPTLNGLVDWYPKSVAGLPDSLARLVCQRANCWWDSNLRKKYANVLLGLLIVIVVSVFVIALLAGQKVEGMILSVYAPIAPAVLWSCREIRRQREAAESLDKLKAQVEKIWSEAIAGRLDNQSLATASREIQDAIYDGRARNPLIFDWINALVRPSQQLSMDARAAELVVEAKAAGNCIK